jgi:hypothetical protein
MVKLAVTRVACLMFVTAQTVPVADVQPDQLAKS